jgi:hypothetical protein
VLYSPGQDGNNPQTQTFTYDGLDRTKNVQVTRLTSAKAENGTYGIFSTGYRLIKIEKGGVEQNYRCIPPVARTYLRRKSTFLLDLFITTAIQYRLAVILRGFIEGQSKV